MTRQIMVHHLTVRDLPHGRFFRTASLGQELETIHHWGRFTLNSLPESERRSCHDSLSQELRFRTRHEGGILYVADLARPDSISNREILGEIMFQATREAGVPRKNSGGRQPRALVICPEELYVQSDGVWISCNIDVT
jgi:hypothetical protein